MKTLSVQRYLVRVNGHVQGVGFRPFVYRLAHQNGLTGFVNNNSEGVLIEVEGDPECLSRFMQALRQETPPLAQITALDQELRTPQFDKVFTIHDSDCGQQASTLISPDAAICRDCTEELFNPENRRYRYPFINCTNCGPRFTIVKGVPYDRSLTTMTCFPLCKACGDEYHNPLDRRFHAQPNACHICGPQVQLNDSQGRAISSQDPITHLVSRLKEGAVAAVRGLGGFHLMVDARNNEAVQKLRIRKGREEKPLALMAPNLQAVRRFCETTPMEEALLQSPGHPIVLFNARKNHDLAPSVAPGFSRLGFMLPYTPLHHLILANAFQALVMTSGNLSEEPIITDNEEALQSLGSIADVFLLHNRDILQPCDDAIVQIVDGQPQILRRARGYTPGPVFLSEPGPLPVLACGGQFKNSFALSRGSQVFLSQHIGDMDHVATLAFAQKAMAHFQQILQTKPEMLVCDRHPNYLISKWARSQNLPVVEVFHHHAHLASVMAENGISDVCIGIILDGSGFGPDGSIWGGEVLLGNFHDFQRFAWLQPMLLPGSSSAIREPWRLALAALHLALGQEAKAVSLPGLNNIKKSDKAMIFQMMEQGINTPSTSSAGRLFDAVSALLGLCSHSSFEAQAAMKLEAVADSDDDGLYSCHWEKGPLPSSTLIKAVLADLTGGVPIPAISSRFHKSLAEIFVAAAISARTIHGLNRVALSGGVFQNVFFSNYIIKILREKGFYVFTHSKIPCNDGGLALGQIAIAHARRQQERRS